MLALRGRKQTPIEEELLLKLYLSTRMDEFALLGWTENQLEQFLHSQYEAQTHMYRQLYPQAQYDLIYVGEDCIGRFITNKLEQHIHIIDISLFPKYRRKGYATELLRALQREAKEKQISITLSVLQGNPAINLYLRLGFVVTEQNSPYIRMKFNS